uniref:Glycerol kinase 5 n=1 Tax=Sander lucioperca TaxID=283035 RepID=A0A8C9ZJI5_SANLU
MGCQRNGFKKENFILSVDVGTTSIRCHVYDKEAKIQGACTTKVVPLYPEVGYVEMDPDAIWKGFVTVVKGAVQDAGVQMRQIDALGISTQRGTFTTWDRRTGVPFHNFISWQDRRAANLVKSWNSSCTMKAIKGVMKMLYCVTRQKRMLAASLITFSTQHVTFRLVWALTNYKQVRQAVAEGNCCFGTIDTWLLFKLTKGEVHATDYSNASSTGIFDSYQVWCKCIDIFSKFWCEFFFVISMADQQAAVFGECCFDVGDVKITMGTGTFMDINTGSKPHTSAAGLYPLVGWKIGSEVVYLAEGNSADTGTAIKWAQELELFSDVRDTSSMACSVSDSDGVCFVPSFSGLQVPLNDPKACASLMGLKPSTTKSHLVRAILESVAFSKVSCSVIECAVFLPFCLRMDGGVSSNDFVMQLTADLLGRKVARPQNCEMSCLGAAFIAGLGVGFWKTKEELKKLQSTDEAFLPKGTSKSGAHSPSQEYIPVLQSWERAIQRSMNWYKP